MSVLLPYYLFSIALAAVLCACSGLGGWALTGLFLLVAAGAFVGLLLLSVLLLAVISLFVDPTKPQTERSPFFCGIVTSGMGVILGLSRIRLHVTGLEKLPEGRFLLVQNHRSNYDPIVTGWALRRYQLTFISKPQNLHLPVAGRILHKAGHLAIDRENDRAALRTILAAADLLRRGVTSIGVYPEGTRNPTAELLPLRTGAFKIAQKAHVPIVVTYIRGTDEVHKRVPWKATDVFLDIRTVLDAETVQCMKTAEIGEEVKKWISSARS